MLVAEAVQPMRKHSSGTVFFGRRNRYKTLGILSEKDLVYKVVACGKEALSVVTVGQVISAPLISVDITASAYEIYCAMASHRIRHLLITSQGAQVGFVSVRDILKNPII